MNKMALSLLKSQIIPLIEKFEPELQGILTKTVQSLKQSKPEEAKTFYSNWKLLNAAIEKEFAEPAPLAPAPVGGADEATGPIPEASPPIVPAIDPIPDTPVVPSAEATGPSFLSSSGPTGPAGPSIIEQITSSVSGLFESGPTGPMPGGVRKLFAPNGGSYKAGKRKTAKQNRKRTHRVKHRKH